MSRQVPNYYVIFEIAKKEFFKVVLHPIVILLVCIALAFIYFNSAGGFIMLDRLQAINQNNDQFIQGYAQIFAPMIGIFAIIAGFLGVMSISEERSSGSFNVLLTKPIFRRDVILGKMLGLSIFMFLFILTIELLTGLLLVYYFREPWSIPDFLWRFFVIVISSLMTCVLIIELSMLSGLLFKNLLLAVSVVATYIFLDCIEFVTSIFNMYFFNSSLTITPWILLFRIISPGMRGGLFATSIAFSEWFWNALPFIVWMGILIIGVLELDCYVFSRQSETK